MKKHVLTIKQKMSNSGSVHDIESDCDERKIIFQKDCEFAAVLASYYGIEHYSTHNEKNAIKKSYKLRKLGYSYQIIDREGNYYDEQDNELFKTGGKCKTI